MLSTSSGWTRFSMNTRCRIRRIKSACISGTTMKERRPGALGFAEAMILAYNNKNKSKLSLRTLCGVKNVSYDEDEDAGEPGDI